MTSNHDFSSESDHLSIHIFNIFVLETWYWKLWWFSMAFFNSRFFFITLKIMDDPLVEGWTNLYSQFWGVRIFRAEFFGPFLRTSKAKQDSCPVPPCHRTDHDTSTVFSPTKVNGSWNFAVPPKLSSFCHFSKYRRNSMKFKKAQLAFHTTGTCLYRFPVLKKTQRWTFGHQRAPNVHLHLKVGKEFWSDFLVHKNHQKCKWVGC